MSRASPPLARARSGSSSALGTMVNLEQPPRPLEHDVDGCGPRAGGAKLSPPPAEAWEWECRTDVVAVGAAEADESEGKVTHTGRCHCGAVRFECDAPSKLVVWDCNCSVCRMRRNLHLVVPKGALRLTDGVDGQYGESQLAEYRWGSGVARHLFCARCGISPFYAPRSNPDGWAITFPCLDAGTVSSVEVRTFAPEAPVRREISYRGSCVCERLIPRLMCVRAISYSVLRYTVIGAPLRRAQLGEVLRGRGRRDQNLLRRLRRRRRRRRGGEGRRQGEGAWR